MIEVGKKYRIKPGGIWGWAAGSIVVPKRVSAGVATFQEAYWADGHTATKGELAIKVEELEEVEWCLLERGGPWVLRAVTPPAASGNPATWPAVDRARAVLGKKEGATFAELTNALSDLVFAWYKEVEEKQKGRIE